MDEVEFEMEGLRWLGELFRGLDRVPVLMGEDGRLAVGVDMEEEILVGARDDMLL